MFCGVYSSERFSNRGVSYTYSEIAKGLAEFGFDTVVHVPWQTAREDRFVCRPAVPKLAAKFLRRLVKPIQEARFLRDIEGRQDAEKFAYLWPDASLRLVRRLKKLGIPMVREMINCHVATAQRILGEAYGRRGLPAAGPSDAHVAYERAVLALVDRVVVSNDEAAASLVANGVGREKIIVSSYGWDPARVLGGATGKAGSAKPTFLFVGTLCVRKAVDALLAAWEASGIDGTLVLLGGLRDEVARVLSAHRSSSVVHLPFSENVSAVFRSADVFVMPSLEEGGPMVTYEAIGMGLPVIATPMGAGFGLRDGVNGILVPPDDASALASAIRTLAGSAELRERYGRQSLAMAEDFTWAKVARTRAGLIHNSLFGHD